MFNSRTEQPSATLNPRLLAIANICGLVLAALMLFTLVANLGTSADDSVQYHQAAINVLSVGDPYATTPSDDWEVAAPNPNPPLLAYLLAPAAGLPHAAFRLAWFALNSVVLLALLALCLRVVDTPWLSQLAGLLLAGVLFWPAAYVCLSIGQLGLILALLAVLSFALAERRPLAAGASLAVGAAIKLYPGLLGGFFLIRGPRRVLWFAAASGLLLLSIPLLAGGLAPYQDYARKVLLGGFYPYPAEFNISLNGLWSRLFTRNEYFRPIAELPALARLLTLAGAAAVLGGCAWASTANDKLGRLIGFAAWLCGMQLLTPLNGYYNLPALLLPFLTLCRCLGRYPSRPAAALLALATALLYIPPGWNRGLPWLDKALMGGPGLILLAPSLYGAILYLALLLAFARSHKKATTE
jgi:hypothetical protein